MGYINGEPVIVLRGYLDRSHVPSLCRRIAALLLSHSAGLGLCDVGGIFPVDAGTVDGLARLQLAVKKRGYRLRYRNVSDRLRELLTLMGLAEVVGIDDDISAVEMIRQAEEREQPRGVQEEDDAPDSAVGNIEDL